MTVDDKVFLGFFGGIALFMLLWGIWTFYVEPIVCRKVMNKCFPNFYHCLETYNILYDIREDIANEKSKIKSSIDTLTKELSYFEMGSKDYAVLSISIYKLKKEYEEIYKEYEFADFCFKSFKEEFVKSFSFVEFGWLNEDLIKENEWTIRDILISYKQLKK